MYPSSPLLVLLLLALAGVVRPIAAPAQGIDLGWTSCDLSTATANMSYVCTSGVDGSVDLALMATFNAPAGANAIVGLDAAVDLQSQSCMLPGWWDFNNVCRSGRLAVRFGRPSVSCGQGYFARASGGIAAYRTFTTDNPTPAPNRARAVVSMGIIDAFVHPLTPGARVFAFSLLIGTDEPTPRQPPCDGCLVPVNLVLSSMILGSNDGSTEFFLTTPGTRNAVTWQGGFTGDCTPTAARNRTWGQLKSLYR